jgi:hypothetical protein
MTPRRLVMPTPMDEQVQVQLPFHGPVLHTACALACAL